MTYTSDSCKSEADGDLPVALAEAMSDALAEAATSDDALVAPDEDAIDGNVPAEAVKRSRDDEAIEHAEKCARTT